MPSDLLLHLSAWACLALAIIQWFPGGISGLSSFFRPSTPGLEASALILRDLREMLLSGRLPSQEDWARLSSIPEPWGRLTTDCLDELRSSGLPVAPTLERLDRLLTQQAELARQARARLSQAWAQAWICAGFVPATALALFVLLPEVRELGFLWWLAALAALALAALAMAWLLAMAEQARWAGLPAGERPWWPAILCFGERFLASLRAGTPPDLAWTRAMPQIARSAQPLVLAWGTDLWTPTVCEASARPPSWLAGWGAELRMHLQRSVMEGRPSSERVEAALTGLQQQWSARVERELTLLGTRALKPLFALIAPAMMGLLLLGLGYTVSRGLEGGPW